MAKKKQGTRTPEQRYKDIADARKSAEKQAQKLIKERFPEEDELRALFDAVPELYSVLLDFIKWTPLTTPDGKTKIKLNTDAIIYGYKDMCRKIIHLLRYYNDIYNGVITEDSESELLPQIDLYEFLIDYTDEQREAVSERRFIFWIIPEMHNRVDIPVLDDSESGTVYDLLLADVKAWNDADNFISAVHHYGRDHKFIERLREEGLYPNDFTLISWDILERFKSVADNCPKNKGDGAQISLFPESNEEPLLDSKQSEALLPPMIKENPLPAPIDITKPDPTETKALVESFETIKPSVAKYLIGKVVNSATKLDVQTPMEVDVIPKADGNDIGTVIMLEAPEGMREKITAADLSVLRGVCTLLYAGNTILTPQSIRMAMKPRGKDSPITPRQAQRVINSVEKMASLRITLDATDEAIAYGVDIPEGERLIFKDNILKCMFVSTRSRVDGRITKAMWKFPIGEDGKPEMPLLYRYTELVNHHMLTLRMNLLDVPVNDTDENILLRDYLLVKIKSLQNPKVKVNSVVTFDYLYKLVGIDPQDTNTRKERERLRKSVFAMLDKWRDVDKEIDGYEIRRKGKKVITGFKIKTSKVSKTGAEIPDNL